MPNKVPFFTLALCLAFKYGTIITTQVPQYFRYARAFTNVTHSPPPPPKYNELPTDACDIPCHFL